MPRNADVSSLTPWTSHLPASPPSAAEVPADQNVAHWKINGFDAQIVVWTLDEWKGLEVHPPDAQYYPCGIWCALRLL